TRGRREQPAKDANERRLARPVGPEQAVNGAAGHLQTHAIERDEGAELACDRAHFDRRGLPGDRAHLGTRLKAAMPARSSSAPSRMPRREANTWSGRSSAVCRLRGEYSPTLLMYSTRPRKERLGNESTEMGTSCPT